MRHQRLGFLSTRVQSVEQYMTPLPRLKHSIARRFARALTGSQASGDACVAAALEKLLADTTSTVPARIGLYRAVLANVNDLESRSITLGLPTPEMEPVQRNLAGLTPMGRQAFLLVAMEEFSIADAARVLELSEDETGVLLEEARKTSPLRLPRTSSLSRMSRLSRWTCRNY